MQHDREATERGKRTRIPSWARDGWRGGILISAATLGLLGTLFFLLELAVRWFLPPAPGSSGPHLEAMLWAAGPCYRIEGRPGEEELVEVRPPDPRYLGRSASAPLRVPFRKRPGVKRWVVIGESSATMLENSLLRFVQKPECEGGIEVLPCSVPGGNLAQVERRFAAALDYDPDAIVVLVGHNLYFSNPVDPVAIRRELLLSHSQLLSHLQPARPEPTPPTDVVSPLKLALQHFGRVAAERNITLVLNTMASNLWFHPVEPGGEPPDRRKEFLAALWEDDRGFRPAAVARLERWTAAQPSAAGEFQLARWLRETGDFGAARHRFERARDLDPMRFRASGAVNEAIREIARPPTLLRDTERALADAAPHGIPGWESFGDNCHLRSHGLSHEVAALVTMLAGEAACGATEEAGKALSQAMLDDSLGGIFGQGGTTRSEERAAAWWANLPPLVEQAARDNGAVVVDWLEEAMERNDFRQLRPAQQAAVQTGMAEGLWQAGLPAAGEKLNAQARGHDGSAAGWIQRGRWLVRQGQLTEAREAFVTARKAEPSQAEATYFLSRVESAMKEGSR